MPRAELHNDLHPSPGDLCGCHSGHASSLSGRLLLDAGRGTAALEQGGSREHAPRPQDEAVLCCRLG